jgi:hypothetical protein
VSRIDLQAKREYQLGIRMSDQAFERFTHATPTVAGASSTLMLRDVIDNMIRIREARDRLAALWTSFRAERLALYRDLGVLPYDNWDAFCADVSARHAAAEEAPAAAAAGTAPVANLPPAPAPSVARSSRP